MMERCRYCQNLSTRARRERGRILTPTLFSSSRLHLVPPIGQTREPASKGPQSMHLEGGQDSSGTKQDRDAWRVDQGASGRDGECGTKEEYQLIH